MVDVVASPLESPEASAGALLSVRDLTTRFDTSDGAIHAVNGISFDVGRGEVLGVVGESGSGKSVSMLSIVGLLPSPPAHVTGSAVLDGQDLLSIPDAVLRRIRGREIGMVFQDPMSSLNPVMTVGAQIEEVLSLHLRLDGRAAHQRALELLKRVGIPDAGRRIDDHPHQFSGGMRQRVMIAMALACDPKLLIADEPTTALDVTIQAQIVALVRDLQADLGMSVIWITHDLGVVATLADRVVVMYGGRVLTLGYDRDADRSSRPRIGQGGPPSMASARVIALRDTHGFQHGKDDYWYRPMIIGDNLFSYVAHVPPGGDMPADAEEAKLFELSLFMLGGTLHVTFGDEQLDLTAGEGLFVPRGVAFGVRNDSDVIGTFFLTFTPPPNIKSIEEMIERFNSLGRAVKSPDEMAEMVGASPIPGN